MESTEEISEFWRKKQEYEERDIFPTLSAEEISKFDSNEYYDNIMELHHKPQAEGSALQFIFIYDESDYIGFTMYKTYLYEDGKTFILDYCIEPDCRNKGIGSKALKELEDYLKEEGSTYIELNSGDLGEPNSRFWLRQGFIPAGRDDQGVMIYVKK